MNKIEKIKVKPFIKWVGGKRQLLATINNYFPKELKTGKIKKYYEPFLGGGAVFFDITNKYDIETAYLSDINEELILVYKVVQKNVNDLIAFLEKYKKQYLKLTIEKRSDLFYSVRKSYNINSLNINHNKYSELWIPRAAKMIFLNKTCFNGLFRLNRKGEFNVSFGKYKNPKFYEEENLKNIAKVLQNAELKATDFSNLRNNNAITKNAFVYFDPPYRPISKTSSFTNYTGKMTFNDQQQIRLSHIFRELNKLSYKLMLSNSDPKNTNLNDNFFEKHYNGFNINRVLAGRTVNSKGNKRGKINELLITNF